MIITLLGHTTRQFFRSSAVGKSVAIKITLGVLTAVVVGYSLAFGFALERVIVNSLKAADPVSFLNGVLLYYFVCEFALRYFFQKLPVMDAQPYLHLPVPKSNIVNFMLGRSLVHPMNVFVFLLFTPFALNAVTSAHGARQALTWLLFLWLISMANHVIVMLFKKMFDHNGWGLMIFIALTGALAASDYFGSVDLSTASKAIFTTPLQGLTSAAVALLILGHLYAISYWFLKNRLYPEELAQDADGTWRISNWAFLQNLGLIGEWIALEVKLILRHKRTRGLIFVNILFLSYALIFRNGIKNEAAYGTFLFIGLMTTGVFAMNYGQFLFSWQAKHFDFTLTQPTSIRTFVVSKYWLLTSMNVLMFLCAIPFVYFGWIMLLANVAAVLFNIGINTFILMNMAMWGAQKIDLTRSGTLNYEGIGAAQWLMGFPLFASPYIIYIPFSLIGHPIPGVIAVGVVGLIGIIFRNKLTDLTTRRLWNMRYGMASNFRN